MVKQLSRPIISASILVCFGSPVTGQVPLEIPARTETPLSYTAATYDRGAIKGKWCRWGGTIEKIEEQESGSVVTVHQTPLTEAGAPISLNATEGRFMAIANRKLDHGRYVLGRILTVEGRAGDAARNLDKEYTYPPITMVRAFFWVREAPKAPFHCGGQPTLDNTIIRKPGPADPTEVYCDGDGATFNCYEIDSLTGGNQAGKIR